MVTMVALAGGWSAASGMDDRPVIDPGVRAVVSGGTLRVLVELRVPRGDPVALGNVQDEVLHLLAGTGGTPRAPVCDGTPSRARDRRRRACSARGDGRPRDPRTSGQYLP